MRSYALALLAASGSAAMPASYQLGTTKAAVALSSNVANYKSIAAGQVLKWGYDAAKIYVSYDGVGTGGAPIKAATTDTHAFGVKVKLGASGALILACEHKSGGAATSSAIWWASHATSSIKVTSGCTSVDWKNSGCMRANGTDVSTNKSVGAKADNAKQTAATTKTGLYSILDTSTSLLDTARKVITCHIDMMIELGSATLTLNQAQAVGLNKINAEAVQNFGTTLIGVGYKTDFKDATFFNYTPTAAVAVASGASKFSIAAGQTVAGLVVTHSVNAWTATAVVYVEYEWKMTLTAALTASAKNSATTCSKIATAVWQCAIMETTGIALNSSIGVIMKFKGYSSTAALAFTSGLPEIAANLGKVANVIKEYEMTNVATGSPVTAAIPSLPSGFVAGMLQSNKWAWYAAGNTMDTTFKIFNGKVQYFSTEKDAAAATAVVTTVTAYAPTAWVGACLGSTCLYGAKALAATSASAGSGSLGLASVGAAIVLAMAF